MVSGPRALQDDLIRCDFCLCRNGASSHRSDRLFRIGVLRIALLGIGFFSEAYALDDVHRHAALPWLSCSEREREKVSLRRRIVHGVP